jgi:hypothetical protein
VPAVADEGCTRTHRPSPGSVLRGSGAPAERSPSSGGRRRPRAALTRGRAPARARELGRSRARPAAGVRAEPTSRRRPAGGRAQSGRLRAPPRPLATRRTSAGGPRPWPVLGRRTPLAPTRSGPEDSPGIARRPPARVARNDGTTAARAGAAPGRMWRRTATGLHRNRRRPVGRERRSLDRARRNATSRRRHAQGNGTSIRSPAPLTAIVRACWVFNNG